ncbi:MAG: hypothetical protein ABJA74_16295 [Lapillicoccus sp.]
MLFWGWGGKSMTRQITPEQAVLLTYRYLHLMFVFTTTWGYKYALATATDQGWATRPIPDAEALQLLGGQELRPSAWKRFSVFLLLGIVLLVVVVAALG